MKLDPSLNLAGHGSLSMILAKQLYIQNDNEELLFQAIHQRVNSAVVSNTAVASRRTIVLGVNAKGDSFIGEFENGDEINCVSWHVMPLDRDCGVCKQVTIGPSGVFLINAKNQIYCNTLSSRQDITS